MLLPVVIGLGDDGNDALDLVLQGKRWTCRQEQALLLAARFDVFQDDRRAQPRRHLARVASHRDPSGLRCFGKETGTKLGLVFPSDSPASEWQSKHGLLASKLLRSLPVHPTQIYESAAALAIAAFCLFYVQSRKRYDGQVFFAFIALYAVARFLIEIFRSDDRGGFWGLSTSQLIGVGLLVAVFVAHRRFSARAAVA